MQNRNDQELNVNPSERFQKNNLDQRSITEQTLNALEGKTRGSRKEPYNISMHELQR
jgi:hypothetical protein